jgi:phosphotransferase system HPr-like phosphotransfer protein
MKKWVEITTEILDEHNDYIQIYTRQDEKGQFIASDDGYTLNDLRQTGIETNLTEILGILQRFGVQGDDGELIATGDDENSVQKNLLRAIQAIKKL